MYIHIHVCIYIYIHMCVCVCLVVPVRLGGFPFHVFAASPFCRFGITLALYDVIY